MMDIAGIEKLNRLHRARERVAALSNLDTHQTRVLGEEDQPDGDIGSAVAQAYRAGSSLLVETANGRYFLNLYLPPPRLVIIGAVHISQTLAQIARLVEFEVWIVDPRSAFGTSERFNGINLTVDWPADAFRKKALDTDTALVALTHDPKIDDSALIEAIRARCFYVGALGSRATHRARLERLRDAGLSERELTNIHAPIGVSIGAKSPAEIAISIIAEVIGALRLKKPDV